MTYIIRISIATFYSICVFSLSIVICLFRAFNTDNLFLVGRMLSWKSFKILGIKFEKRGEDKVKGIGPAIFISNHQDNLDVIIGAICVQRKTVLIAKKSVLWIPLFGQFYWLTSSFLIDRKNKKKAKESMRKVSKRVSKEKVNIWILPEGTRSRGRGLLPFKKGAFITAIDCQVPIVPVVWSSYYKKLDFSKKCSGKIIAQYLDPIQTTGKTLEDLEQLMIEAYNVFESNLKAIDKEIEQLNLNNS